MAVSEPLPLLLCREGKKLNLLSLKEGEFAGRRCRLRSPAKAFREPPGVKSLSVENFIA